MPVVLQGLNPLPSLTNRLMIDGASKLPPLCPGSMVITLPARGAGAGAGGGAVVVVLVVLVALDDNGGG